MPQSVGPRTLKRTAALYEYNKEVYAERIENLQTDLTGRVLTSFFSEKPDEYIG